MAIQDSLLTFKGQMGGISFYKSRNGTYSARKKGGIDAKRLKTDPAFQRTRENSAEFANAASAARALRRALVSQLQSAKDSGMSARLTREMIKVLRGDLINPRGKRNPMEGDLSVLAGFEFNENAPLSISFRVPHSVSIDRVLGTLSLDIPAYKPAYNVVQPVGATHYQLMMAGVEVNLADGTFTVDSKETALTAIGGQDEPAQLLTATVSAQSANPLFVIVGIRFSQLVNGEQYPLHSGAFNALSIAAVDKV